jgi:NAD+--asparagine ADP-ribosyltransferase
MSLKEEKIAQQKIEEQVRNLVERHLIDVGKIPADAAKAAGDEAGKKAYQVIRCSAPL